MIKSKKGLIESYLSKNIGVLFFCLEIPIQIMG